LIDFGLATANNKNRRLSTSVGTAIYCAPEVVSSDNYTEKCDVFSFGIVMWILAHEDEKFFIFNSKNSFTALIPIC
jgi:serine/threonine protein kinase